MDQVDDLPALLHAVAYPTADYAAYAQNEATLQSSLKIPGFFNKLQEIAADRSFPKEVRLLSSLLISREAPKKWRARTMIPDELKPDMRQRFFLFFEEEDLQIARSQLQLLVLIARQEYPKIWPSLLQDLLGPLQQSFSYISSHSGPQAESVRSQNPREWKKQKTILLNSFWTWNAFVKEWRSVKVPVGTKLMTDFVKDLRGPMLEYLEALMSREPVLEDWEIMESARYAFKISARLVDWEFSRPGKGRVDPDPSRANTFISNTLRYLSRLQEIRLQLLSSPMYAGPSNSNNVPVDASRTLKSLTKFIRAIGKFYENMMHIDPKAFAAIDGTVNAVGWWWGEVATAVQRGEMPQDDDETALYPKRFMLLGLVLFKNILPVLSTDHKHIFTDNFVSEAFHLIVDKLLPLNTQDWQSWQDDPEEWFVTQMDVGLAWSYEFRPCAERLLMGLTSAARDRNVIEPLILQKLQASIAHPATDMDSRIRQDAVLNATGRMARALANQVKLDQILPFLSTALTSNAPEDRIMKYRIACFIGLWVSADEDSALLPIIWNALTHLLGDRGEGSDIAVRLAAATAIKQSVDLWELDIAYFEPYLSQIMSNMLQLVSEAETLPAKRQVLEAVSVIIERIGIKTLPYLSILSEAIPVLWQGSGGLDGEWLFKASLVLLTTKLVAAIGPATSEILPLVVPLIEESLSSPAKEYFEADGLILWSTTLRHVANLNSTGGAGLLKLYPGLLTMLGQDMDNLQQSLQLVDSYMLLDGQSIVQTVGEASCDAFAAALRAADKNNVKMVLESLTTLIRLTSSAYWAPRLAQNGVFQALCDGLDDEKASGTVLAAQLVTLCRVIMVDPSAFYQCVKHIASTKGLSETRQLETTLDAMWRSFDYVGVSYDRKLIALAFANLLTLGNPQIYDRLDGEFVNVWLDTLGEIKESAQAGPSGTEILHHWKDDHPLANAELTGTEELKRKEAFESADPVYAALLTDFVRERLSQAQHMGMGPYWAKLDADVQRQLEKLMS
ncbi:hypothetical protein NliqN6_3399 [Naganishia liquefaciens]|uniref:Importin N-terminal domain-containing protein n=1 Tax=Naganishia liquefaciens TaxID=104408 RepID=A0A8H3YG91_9TREE|nr:hypothetical protein NliqN6_3399 [Naganishia liquefaciens]